MCIRREVPSIFEFSNLSVVIVLNCMVHFEQFVTAISAQP